ncbi:MAG: hypothetical protein S4CHLAM45_09400 [Chlamydiales bacterium]|nr:hypothetical protein [Chlamydiales bacterium]MCH9620091.1 hypothetical protein [Chlamydiales bacterium]MCH9623044.1 hypothetical protein [Chlamydiales bacterium]
MTRTSKQEERRNRSPRKHKKPSVKTGSKKDNLPKGFKPHENALSEKINEFIPKVRSRNVKA